MSSLPAMRSASRAPAARRSYRARRAFAAPPFIRRLPALDGVSPVDAAEALRDLPGLALLESARPGRTGRWSYLAADPLVVLDRPAAGPDLFVEARSWLTRLGAPGTTLPLDAGPEPPARRRPDLPPMTGGLVGYLGYDLARQLERLPSAAAADQTLPPMRLALHDWVLAWDRRTGAAWLGASVPDGDRGSTAARITDLSRRITDLTRRIASLAERPTDRPGEPVAPLDGFVSRTSHEAWIGQVEAVRAAIARGDIYQANLARRLEAPFDGDPWPLFRHLRAGDPALFTGFLDLGQAPEGGSVRALLSASPEPFLAVDADRTVRSDPIKGTRPRGRTPVADRALARELLASAKDQAENVMIVDVLRNDLGRVCVPGTVRVPRLLRLERSASVQHLVTTVTGRLRQDADAFDLLAASFPGGSITGAPKIRAMEVIESLEPVRRGPYCGAMVWLGPDGRLGSSVLIRTFVADGARLTLHVGGGITWRSDPENEWQETVAKSRGPLGAIGAAEAAP